MALAVAAVLFGIFAVNVVIGATSGAAFLGDTSEMLVLFVTSLFFVAGVLRREAKAKADPTREDETDRPVT